MLAMIERRSFFTALAAVVGLRPAAAAAQSALQPVRHEQDDWMEKLGSKHRLVFDTTAAEGFGSALAFAGNFLDTNKNAYGLEYPDLGVIIVARHNSTQFAYNDMMWSKYGRILSQRAGFTDPKTKEMPTSNLFNASGYGTNLSNLGTTLDSLTKRGAHFGVCRLATRFLAGAIARDIKGEADKINEELIANIVTNAHMVPAGIVAVSRAQERGYTITVGV
jgi:hypothetical protein